MMKFISKSYWLKSRFGHKKSLFARHKVASKFNEIILIDDRNINYMQFRTPTNMRSTYLDFSVNEIILQQIFIPVRRNLLFHRLPVPVDGGLLGKSRVIYFLLKRVG